MNHPEAMLPAGADNLAARLGLAFDPLAPGALPDFFFAGGRRRFVVQQIVHALYFSGGMVLLTGDRGAGKTRVVDEVCRELGGLAEICRIDATVMMDASALRQPLAAALGLPPVDDNERLLAELAHAAGDAEAQPLVLVVDDAQLLAVPDLAECEQLVQGAGGRLRLLLIGEPELLAAWEQLGVAGGERVELPALQAREVADYLRTRFQAAGYQEELPLGPEQLQELMRHSRGNIADIHDLVALMLGGGSSRPSKPAAVRKKLPLLPIGGAVAALTVLLVAALYHGGGDDKADASGQVALPVPVADGHRVSLPIPAVSDAPQPQPIAEAAAPAAEAPASASGMVREPIALPPPPAAAAMRQDLTPAAAQPAPVQRNPEPAVALAQNAAVPAPAPATPVAAAKPVSRPSAQPAKTSSAKPQSAAKSQSAAKAQARAKTAAKPAKSAAAKASAQQTAANTAAKNKVAQPAAATTALSADERHLMSLPSQQFVVQLMAGYSREKVAGFIGSAGHGLKVYYFESRLQGKPWYVAVTGPYADRGAASSAIAKLDPALRKEKPWPRSLATVQSDLHAHDGH